MPVMPRPNKAKGLSKKVLKNATAEEDNVYKRRESLVADMEKDYTRGLMDDNKQLEKDMKRAMPR